MTNFEIFPKAPISEAILDIQVTLPQNTEIDSFSAFKNGLSGTFSEQQTIRTLKGTFKFDNDNKISGPTQETGTAGYLFRSKKEKKVIQVRIDGFTFNKLKPYDKWEVFQQEAKSWWEKYTEIANPEKVNRIALRYINVIEAQLPIVDFNEYLLTNPQIAPGLPQSVSNFLLRLEVPNPEIRSYAIITTTMNPPTNDNILPLVLDIDVIKKFDYENIDIIWDDFEKLRHFKNDIFFKSTTDKAKESFR